MILTLHCWSSRPLLECLSHQHLLKPFVSLGSQDSTVQRSSPHKYSQEVWWDALNVVATTFPSVTSGLTPFPKFFLYSITSFGNMPLTWPYCPSVWPPRHDGGLLSHGYYTWRKYLFKFLYPTIALQNFGFFLLSKEKNGVLTLDN